MRIASFLIILVAAVTCTSAWPACAAARPGSSAAPAFVPDPAARDAYIAAARALAASQRADGAIAYTATQVNPYFANLAATGAARTSQDPALVRAWIGWYVARSRDPNPWNIAGAITDYTIASDGSLHSTGMADSIDAYAATFITLVATAWQNGDAKTRALVRRIGPDVDRIAAAIDAVTDVDGLTWALPAYRVKYLMDASEVYAGLTDLARLRASVYGEPARARQAAQHAAVIRARILERYWNARTGAFAVSLDASGNAAAPDPASWSDMTTQVAPVLEGLIAPSSTIAATAYIRLNAAFPSWPVLNKTDAYPWASVAYAALLMNDLQRVSAYVLAVDAVYAPQFKYPWYCAETGWYLQLVHAMQSPPAKPPE